MSKLSLFSFLNNGQLYVFFSKESIPKKDGSI